jgi:hypothetical protein
VQLDNVGTEQFNADIKHQNKNARVYRLMTWIKVMWHSQNKIKRKNNAGLGANSAP